MANIFETENLKVVVGTSPYVWSGPETQALQPTLYLLINKKTNVIEAETRLLAQAIDSCKTLESHLQKQVPVASTPSLQDAVDSIPELVPTK